MLARRTVLHVAYSFLTVTSKNCLVSVRGIQSDAPSFLKLHDVDGSDAIILSSSIAGKWEVGSDLVITSNVQNWWVDQTCKVISMATLPTGYVRVGLDRSIERPNTLQDDVGFAVEVAQLSRNILFNSEHSGGGHFWVMETPTVEQYIEGVEIVNFGQAGTLGRYPIHFHLSKDVTGSKVKKNSVRNSNQRCYVVHGSDNLLLEDNVAYNTFGHCYMLEDVSH